MGKVINKPFFFQFLPLKGIGVVVEIKKVGQVSMARNEG